jgi:5-methylcytosine-specific restriction endonuclease McrA
MVGEGPHACAYCGQILHWGHDLACDHVDGDSHNNDPANLVVCCKGCNTRDSRNMNRIRRRGKGL